MRRANNKASFYASCPVEGVRCSLSGPAPESGLLLHLGGCWHMRQPPVERRPAEPCAWTRYERRIAERDAVIRRRPISDHLSRVVIISEDPCDRFVEPESFRAAISLVPFDGSASAASTIASQHRRPLSAGT